MPFTLLPTSAYSTLDATKLSGNLPAINGSSLTNLSAGKVLQVVTASFGGQVGTTSTSWSGTGITASITPSNTSNKVLVMVNFTVHNSQADYGNFQSIFRGDPDSGGTNLGTDATGLGRVQGRASLYHMCSMHILDAPNTTSSQAYETGFKNSTTSLASYTMINNINAKITLMEIDGT